MFQLNSRMWYGCCEDDSCGRKVENTWCPKKKLVCRQKPPPCCPKPCKPPRFDCPPNTPPDHCPYIPPPCKKPCIPDGKPCIPPKNRFVPGPCTKKTTSCCPKK